MSKYTLGLSAFYHDSAACILKDDLIIAAAQEERFTRKKHDPSFPTNAITYCLLEAGIDAEQIDNVVFYEKPLLKFERLFETYLAFAPRGFSTFRKSLPLWTKEKLFQQREIAKHLQRAFPTGSPWSKKLMFSEHHLSHAASAFYPSPFNEAAILTLDGVGEWSTTSLAIGKDTEIVLEKEINFPHSLGLLYSAFTYYTGFKVNSGEYKVMGLAPYGEAKYVKKIKDNLIDIKDDGSFKLDIAYFDYCTGLKMTNKKFDQLFGRSPRTAEAPLTQVDMDLAASIQAVTEEVVIKLCKSAKHETGQSNLCLAGGVALNCVANGKILEAEIFDKIWIQPAAGDAGGAIGAAFCGYYSQKDKVKDSKSNVKRQSDAMRGAYLGPSFSNEEAARQLKAAGANFSRMPKSQLAKVVAKNLSEGLSVGWMQGRMEFGPRALGNRSILADPRSPKMQKRLNLQIKFRESFRPFAPSILSEDLEGWFKMSTESPYMLMVANIQDHLKIETKQPKEDLFGIELLNIPRSQLPAITHVDYSARVQTVHKETNAKYFELLQEFKALTGCPILVNTSFNVRGEPIVCNPTDAFKCFVGTDLDILVVGDLLLRKEDQDKELRYKYFTEYELD